MNDQSIGAREQAVLIRLALLNPYEGGAGALKALDALKNQQDILPLMERFNVAREAARQIQAEAGAGAWLIALLENHLDQLGVPAVRSSLRGRLFAWLVRQLRPYLLDLIAEAVAQLQAQLRADLVRQRTLSGTNGRVEVNGRPVRRFIGSE